MKRNKNIWIRSRRILTKKNMELQRDFPQDHHPRFSTKCNRGCWPLLWPFRSCRHCSCRCSISGNYRTGASTTPPVARVLADPDGSSTSAIPVSVLRSSCNCLEVVSIFLFNSKTIVTIYLNAGRSIQLFHRGALRDFFTDSLSHCKDQLVAFPKTEFSVGPRAPVI